MAVYNEIQVGRYNRLFQKLLSMKGGAVMSTLAPEMLPVMPVFIGAENRYLESWDRFGISVVQTGGAGTFPLVRFRNPANSAVVVVLERLVVMSNNADSFDLNLGAIAVDLSAVGLSGRLDARGRSASSLLESQSSPAVTPGVGTRILRIAAAANAPADFIITDIQELTILPGDAVQMQPVVTANSTLTTSAIWRERFLEESERT